MDSLLDVVNAAKLSGGVTVRALHTCPHISHVNPIPIPVAEPACATCGITGEVWTCLMCNFVGCGRGANAHGVEHFTNTGHPLVLGNADLSVWCHACESYLDVFKIQTLHAVFNAAHFVRFGVNAALPSTSSLPPPPPPPHDAVETSKEHEKPSS